MVDEIPRFSLIINIAQLATAGLVRNPCYTMRYKVTQRLLALHIVVVESDKALTFNVYK